MQTFTMFVSLILTLTVLPTTPWQNRSTNSPASQTARSESPAKQLLAVRGEVTKKEAYNKGWLKLTIKSLRDAVEVVVLARETDLVGNAVNRSGDKELLNLLSENSHENESITAAELDEGDLVSVIYDPQQQNRALEIYIH